MSHESCDQQSEASQDQRAVNDYFDSETYREISRQERLQREPSILVVGGAKSLSGMTGTGSSRASFILGLAGLNIILIVFAVMTPIAISTLETVISRSNGFAWMMLFVQTIIFPPIISFSFATVTPMFWHGSVMLRFLTGILMVAPACVIFYVMMSLLEGSPPDDFSFAFAGVMFTQFLVAGIMALIVQMWSPWTLTHTRDANRPLPPLGMMSMLELTGVAAIGCSIFMWEGFGDIIEGVIFFAGMGFISSMAVITLLIALLRDRRRNRFSALIAFLASFAMAFLLCSFFAIQEFGWQSITWNFLFVCVISLYGAIVISAVMWLCVGWLRLCGWRCVNRRLQQVGSKQTVPT